MECVQEEEAQMKVEGTYELYERTVMFENKKSWLRDIKQGLEEFEKKFDSDFEQVVNSRGDTVEWDGFGDEKLEEMMKNARDFISNFEEHLEEEEKEIEKLREETEGELNF